MYGYTDKRLVQKARFVNYSIPLCILLSLLLLISLKIIVIDSGILATIIVALIGWPLAIDNVFLQINNSLKRKLESDAVREIDGAMNEIGAAFAAVVTFANDFVVKPMDVPEELWYKAANDKYSEITTATMQMRTAFGGFYRAIEANEIIVIHLEQYYRYLTITIDVFIEHVDSLSSKFLLATSNWRLPEKSYIEEAAKFRVLQDEWSTIASYMMDFRKMLQNELLGDIFKRELEPRKPLPGYGTTLDKVATLKEVKKMIDERNNRFNIQPAQDQNQLKQ